MSDYRSSQYPHYGVSQPGQVPFPPQGQPQPRAVPSGSMRGCMPPAGAPVPRPQAAPYASYPGSIGPAPSAPSGPRSRVPSGNVSRKPAGFAKYRNILFIAAAVLVILLVVVFSGITRPASAPVRDAVRSTVELNYNVFCPGVYVDGLSLSGLTADEGWNAVRNRSLQQLNAWHVDLTYNGFTNTITASAIGMEPDVSSALDAAWEIGHNYNGKRSDRELYDEIAAVAEEPRYFSTGHTSGDVSRIIDIVYTIKQSLDRSPQNAEMTGFYPDRENPFEYSDEIAGLNLDAQALVDRIADMAARLESGTLAIEPEQVAPEQTKNSLSLLYTKRGEAVTQISSSSDAYRNDNIRLAFSRFNGYRLDPGAVFSFNGIVGERSTKNGFNPAEEYDQGEHVMGVGGGVCQASTTVYQAAVRAGLEVTDRSYHSDKVNYTDYGLDATVSWGSNRKVDLKFVNNTDSPVYIAARVEPGKNGKNSLQTHVIIYGRDLGGTSYEIKSEKTGELVASGGPKYIKDTEGKYATYTDEQVSVSDPKMGYEYMTYREEYRNGRLIERKELGRCTYPAQPEKIYVGVKKR